VGPLLEKGTLWVWGYQGVWSEGVYPGPEKINLPKGMGRISGIIAGNAVSAVVTGCGDFYIRSDFDDGFKLMELEVQVPARREVLWPKIFQWLFLGRTERNSAFYSLPVEVLYHMLLIYT
jgi:hypothetical protein